MPRQEAGEPYYRVTLDEAKEMIDEGNDQAIVVDVRRDDEWGSGHVAGAIHMPVDDFMDRVDELPHGKKLLFICAQGVRSGLACEMAASVGISSNNLFNIEEGTYAWIEKEYPTSYDDDT